MRRRNRSSRGRRGATYPYQPWTSSNRSRSRGEYGLVSKNDVRFLKRITRVLKLAKTTAGLLVTLIVLAGIAVAGSTPGLLQGSGSPSLESQNQSGNSAQAKNGNSKVDSRPIFNVVFGSKNVNICKK